MKFTDLYNHSLKSIVLGSELIEEHSNISLSMEIC